MKCLIFVLLFLFFLGLFFFGVVFVVELILVNFGGVNGNVQKVVYVEFFQKSIGIKVVMVEFNGELVKVKVMVEVKKVSWDVVEIDGGDLICVCDDGFIEKFDLVKIIKKDDYIFEVMVSECGMGVFVWFIVLVYNVDKFKIVLIGWVDFWDIKKYFGKCGMKKSVQYNLEFVFMVDGVLIKDVYKVLVIKEGVDCVFKKLD